ncbi:MAG: hypothetical protein EOO29_32995 [Comamonadaceae bacterium]|nr:MAG: hypothetical protein EOO29_32995 [Comamonadaceae bacterium]
MAARVAFFTAPGLCLAATLLMTGCANTGVGMAASNRGAAVGVSVGTPSLDSAPRGKWAVLPPPQLMTPEQIKAAKEEPAASSASPPTPTRAAPKP